MKKIELTQGKVALVDDADFDWLNQHKWCAHRHHTKGRFYVVRAIGKRPYRRQQSMHRLITDAKYGQEIDHINGNGLDNRRGNLRKCTSSQNKMNLLKRKGISKYKGVLRNKSKFQARIKINYKSISLGSFNNEIEAAKAYDKAAIEYFEEFARLNFNSALKKDTAMAV